MCGIWAIFGFHGDVSTVCNDAHKISYRGPDAFRIETIHCFPSCCLGFHRLAIMDDLHGMQPMRVFRHPHVWLTYNGEIYNFKRLQKEFGFKSTTSCDGEVIIHLYAIGGIEFAAKHLDGTFAFCLFDTEKRNVYLGRDTFGVRPLFRLFRESGLLAVSSEAKGLMNLISSNNNEVVEAFLPGYVQTYRLNADGEATLAETVRFHDIGQPPTYSSGVNIEDSHSIEGNIRALLEDSVRKRMMAERRVGCLISGGLDSSLVASIVVKIAKEYSLPYKVQSFVVGMENSTDLLAAKKVADYLGTEHHEVIFSPEEAISAIEDVCYHLESYDVITIRASVPMYLLMKYIRKKTDTIVILSGEGSDEIAQGYICFHNAPSNQEADEESRRLCKDLYLYDVLRVDRCTAAWGLEIRVPFLDHKLTSYYLSLPVELRRPINGVEKFTIRSAFKGQNLIPDEILWRPKEGFSDGVSSTSMSWYKILTDHFNKEINDSEIATAAEKYKVNPPKTKEALFYRRVFEKYYKGHDHFTPYFWMPKWSNTTDPSSRTLENYKQ